MTLARPPSSPLDAVTHLSPYPYYARLRAERPLYRDEALGLWVASSARAVTDVLASPHCRVRPATQRIPPFLQGAAAELFGRLVRMRDGAGHRPLRQAVTRALEALGPFDVHSLALGCAKSLAAQALQPPTRAGLEAFTLQLSVHVLGTLLGLPEDSLASVAASVDGYLGAFTPGADAATQSRAASGAAALMDALQGQLARAPRAGLLATLATEAARAGVEGKDAVVANAVGFLVQGYEAGAGLLGNTLLALSARPALLAALRHNPAGLEGVLLEVLRHDAPVHNTRRFVDEAAVVAGAPMAAGDAILVVLASANRDAEANPSPDAFRPARKQRRLFGHGSGVHACPGASLSLAIALGGVACLLSLDVPLRKLARAASYRPSYNVRIPRFV
jgi:cytochrome P450